MRDAEARDWCRDFVMEMLRTGVMFTDLVADLIESLPDDAFPGESITEVVIEMLTGTLRPVIDAAGERSVRSAVALLTASQDRTLADLERLAELIRRREPERPGRRRADG
jgi:hypothetical protein